MDFARIDLTRDAEEGATFHLYDPYSYDREFPDDVVRLYDGGKPITIDLVGPNSPTAKRAAAKMVRDNNAKTGKRRNVRDMSIEDILRMGAENEESRAEFLADCTTGWANITYLDDDKLDDEAAKPRALPFTRENAILLYRTRLWIAEEVDRFLADKNSFRRKIGKS